MTTFNARCLSFLTALLISILMMAALIWTDSQGKLANAEEKPYSVSLGVALTLPVDI